MTQYPHMAITDPRPLRPGDLVGQGLPFYAGRIAMTYDVQGEAGTRVVTRCGDFAVKEIRAGTYNASRGSGGRVRCPGGSIKP